MDFTILDDRFGIHTFMLNYVNLTKKEHERLFKLFSCSIDGRSSNFEYIKTGLLNDKGYFGLYPELYSKNGHYYMSIIVNPRNLIEDKFCRYDILSSDSLESISRIVCKINEALEIISDVDNAYTFENAVLSRVDLCINFRFDNSYVIKQYIKLAKKSCRTDKGKVRYLYTKKNKYDKEGNKHHFGIENTNVELTIYDKDFQLKRFDYISKLAENYGNILRIEVKMKWNLIHKYTENIPGNTNKLAYLLENSSSIMIGCISVFFYSGDYLTLNTSAEIINNTAYHRHVKDFMKEIVAERKNIDSTYEWLKECYQLSEKKIQRIKNKFAECEINPTKISLNDALYGEEKLLGFKNLLIYSASDYNE